MNKSENNSSTTRIGALLNRYDFLKDRNKKSESFDVREINNPANSEVYDEVNDLSADRVNMSITRNGIESRRYAKNTLCPIRKLILKYRDIIPHELKQDLLRLSNNLRLNHNIKDFPSYNDYDDYYSSYESLDEDITAVNQAIDKALILMKNPEVISKLDKDKISKLKSLLSKNLSKKDSDNSSQSKKATDTANSADNVKDSNDSKTFDVPSPTKMKGTKSSNPKTPAIPTKADADSSNDSSNQDTPPVDKSKQSIKPKNEKRLIDRIRANENYRLKPLTLDNIREGLSKID